MSRETSRFPKQAVILSAGESSRFPPFNQRSSHKSTFSMMGKPIISSTIDALDSLGIKDILVVKSPHDQKIDQILLPFSQKMRIETYNQPEKLGMANALLSVSHKLHDHFIVLNPQQINIAEHLGTLNHYPQAINHRGVTLFSQTTNNPQKYGMLALEGNRVRRVVEKPQDLTGLSDQRILGIYMLDTEFINFLATTETSEYQLESALDEYSRQNEVLAFPTEAPSLSLKYAWDLFVIAHHKFSSWENNVPIIDPTAQIHPTAQISGPVVIESGAQIFAFSIIEGPCYIGKNAVVGSYCKVRKGSILEEGVQLQNAVEVKHSIVGRDTHIHSGFLGDSIIGENTRIGAGFITANRRLDRKNVGVSIKGKVVDTGSSFFGSLIGDNVHIGIHCGTNPGVVVPSDSEINPGTISSRISDGIK